MIITECRIIVTYKCQIRLAIAFHCPHNKFINQTRSYHMVGISIKKSSCVKSVFLLSTSSSTLICTHGGEYGNRLVGTKLLMILRCLNYKGD